MSVPTEDEIRDAAKRLGLADEHGNYPQRDRARIAAAVQQATRERAAAGDPATGNTAAMLARFQHELAAVGFTEPSCFDGEPVTPSTSTVARLTGPGEQILVEAARHLLKTAGLQLKPEEEETTP
ncbi:hypothetical protein [Nocardia wallacei]|uniref:hypothetical protein n=1 Tax=Nocardia wallacei TaxID=480035 RepID=UPI0024576130|nr:hypothetical protein [Nocardia wallacei]